MKERPILFSGPMVKAILENRKTMTRRVGREQVHRPVGQDETGWYHQVPIVDRVMTFMDRQYLTCPYASIGDRLWVRETWAPTNPKNPHCRISYRADMMSYGLNGGTASELAFPEPIFPGSKVGLPDKWRPCIHMPRWVSRITLEVTGVRVERLREISAADCKREGVYAGEPLIVSPGVDKAVDDAWVSKFAHVWNSMNGRRAGYRWEDNPWVWVVSFSRIR